MILEENTILSCLTPFLIVENNLMELHGNDVMSYNDLSWYLKALKKYNPGSCVDMEVNACTNQFERVFISFGACLLGFKHYRPMIFLNATHLRGQPGV